jgi:hypothetical protein
VFVEGIHVQRDRRGEDATVCRSGRDVEELVDPEADCEEAAVQTGDRDVTGIDRVARVRIREGSRDVVLELAGPAAKDVVLVACRGMYR